MFGKRKIATIVAEFLGTGILTLIVLSVQRSTIGVPFFVAIAAGLTVAVLVFALGSVSGAHVNPAITIALWTARKVSTVSAILYVAVQLLGAWVAYYLYTYFVNSKLTPIGGHFTGRILVAELVGTAIFAFGWAATVYQGYTKSLSLVSRTRLVLLPHQQHLLDLQTQRSRSAPALGYGVPIFLVQLLVLSLA
jgi:glycerol uptake facilitator-like aquaporin